MKCREVQESLDQMFTVGGLELTPEMTAHLDSCPECREYYEDLVDLSKDLTPLAEISLSPVEVSRLEAGLEAGLDKAKPALSRPTDRKFINIMAPMALAAAAMVVLLLWSPWQNRLPQPISKATSAEIQFENLDADDILPLLTSKDADLLPALVDEKTASYITEQIKPMQADEVLEKLTTDEVKWLNDNLSMEI
jgi:hypothetical protein